MIAKEFPDNVATMFAISETFFGIGMIVGKCKKIYNLQVTN